MVNVPQLNGKNLDCPIIIATSNKFLPLLKPFCFLFNEFWSSHQEVTFVGYESPDFSMPQNFRFVSLGVQRGVKYWADDLRPFIQSLDCDYFAYTAEDMFLAREVNFESLSTLLTSCNNMVKKPGRIALGDSVANQIHEKYKDSDRVIVQSPISNYRLSLQWSMWRKDYFLKYLKPNFSQWDYEVRNMSESRFDAATIAGFSSEYPLGFCNALQTKGQSDNLDFNRLKFDLVDICSHREKKYRTRLDKRYISKMVEAGLIDEVNLK